MDLTDRRQMDGLESFLGSAAAVATDRQRRERHSTAAGTAAGLEGGHLGVGLAKARLYRQTHGILPSVTC
jgi:hypothetical protein